MDEIITTNKSCLPHLRVIVDVSSTIINYIIVFFIKLKAKTILQKKTHSTDLEIIWKNTKRWRF